MAATCPTGAARPSAGVPCAHPPCTPTCTCPPHALVRHALVRTPGGSHAMGFQPAPALGRLCDAQHSFASVWTARTRPGHLRPHSAYTALRQALCLIKYQAGTHRRHVIFTPAERRPACLRQCAHRPRPDADGSGFASRQRRRRQRPEALRQWSAVPATRSGGASKQDGRGPAAATYPAAAGDVAPSAICGGGGQRRSRQRSASSLPAVLVNRSPGAARWSTNG